MDYNFLIQRTNERIVDLKAAIARPVNSEKVWFFEKHLKINEKLLKVLFGNVRL